MDEVVHNLVQDLWPMHCLQYHWHEGLTLCCIEASTNLTKLHHSAEWNPSTRIGGPAHLHLPFSYTLAIVLTTFCCLTTVYYKGMEDMKIIEIFGQVFSSHLWDCHL